MPLTELNHYFVRANDLEKTKDFYVDVLGFEVMPRPNFPVPGYWLGINGKIQRGDAGWVMTAIGEFHDGKTVRAMVDPAKRYL